MRMAIDNVVEEEADEYFVFVVSDANVGRYDITPEVYVRARVCVRPCCGCQCGRACVRVQ